MLHHWTACHCNVPGIPSALGAFQQLALLAGEVNWLLSTRFQSHEIEIARYDVSRSVHTSPWRVVDNSGSIS